MAKDGVVSISIDYKDELNQMIRDYESALTEMASSDKLSKGMKAQFDNTIAELKRFKADMEKSFSDLSIGKVDKNSFKAFKQTVNKNFESVRAEIDNLNLAVSTINSQIKILGGDLDISKISNQFKDFQDYVQNTNNAIDTMIKKLDGQGISLMSFDDIAVNQAKSQIKEINKLLKSTDEFSDAKGSKYELFDTDQAQAELDVLARNLKNTLELIEKSESELSNFDKNSISFEKTINQINILKLKAADLYDSIEQLQIASEANEFGGLEIKDDSAVEKYFKYLDIIPDTLDEIRESAIKTREELEKIVTPVSSKTASAKISDKLSPNSAELVTGVTIETTSNELWKKLSPILNDLQNDLNKNPVVAPVKLVVAPNAVSSEKNGEVGTISKSYSKKYQRELAKTGEDAVIDLEGVYKKTFTSIMDEAVSYSKETISKIQNIFESSPIKLHFDFNEKEFKKLSDALLSSDSGKKIDITGQIAESKKEINELAEKLAEVNELLNSADSKDFSFKGFDKFAEEISKSLGQLAELQSMLKTLQNIESTLARASGVSSVTDIETQWQNVSKLIENSIKLDGVFRKNANVDKLASEYNKYLNMGGTNELSSIGKVGKLENSKNIIDAILSKVKELNSQKVDTSSVDKADDELKSVSSTLDDVISRLDHMINLTRDIGNTFYKIFKDASVSDLDKQWSSIESKFKSIADESGKINLSKQKKDIQELVEMYQKYTNAGGMNTPFDLTDNAETIKKMNKVYKQINSKKDGASVGSESKEFSKIEGSVNSLTSAINTKTEAIKTEANTMELAARAEVKSIQKIIDALNPLIEKIENIPKLKIPKEDTTLSSKESNISSDSTPAIEQQIKSESELNAEIEKRENTIRELQQLQEKLTVHEDFHSNDRYFADQLPTEEEIREADKRIKQLTGTNNIFDVDKLIQDRNEWLSEVKYSLEEYDDLIKANDQKALDEYTTRGLSHIGGAESFFGYEDNNFSIASKFIEEKEKIQNEINDLYTDLNKLDEKMNLDSNNSSVNNIVQSQEKLQSELKETQDQAEKTNQAIKEVTIPQESNISSDSTTSVIDNQIKKQNEYNDLVAVGYDRIQKMKKISESGTTGSNSVYDLLRLNHEAWDEVKANNFFNTIPEEGLKRYTKILEVVEKIVQEMVQASGLTEEQIVSQLKNIKTAQGGSFKLNGADSGWTHFATYSNGQKDSMQKVNGITYKVYAAFDDIKDLNQNVVSSIMDELTKAGFKGRLKTTSGSTSFGDKLNGLAITDQMVVHGSTKKDQEIAYNTLKNMGLKLSYLGGGIDTPDGSFSQVLASGEINKYIQGLEKEATAARDTAKAEQQLAEARKESSTASTEQKKDAFPDSSTNTKPETEGMEQVEKATEEAVQSKKDFATANEGVQSSIDGSKSPLQLEVELMNQIAKSAREAADAKKEFVNANKQVKASADDSNSENKKKDKYAKHNKISEDDFLNNSNKYSSITNEKLNNSGYTILGGTVNSDLIDGLVKVSAKIKDVDGNWKTFSARVDADGNMFSQRFRTITKGVNNLDNELANFGKDKIKVPETDEQVQKFKELNIAINDYASARKRMANDKAFDNDEEDSQKLLKTINEIMGKADGSATILSSKQLSDAQDKLDEIDKTISDIQQKNAQKVNNSLLKIQNNATEKLSKYTDSSKYTPEFIERVNSKIGEIKQLNITKPEDVTRLKTINSKIQEIINDSKLLKNKLVKQDSKIADIISQMKIFASQNTNMSSSQKQNLDSVIKYAEELKNAGKVTAQEIEKIKISFSGLKAEVASTGNMGKNFFSQIGSRLTDMNSKFVAQFLSWQDWIRYIQQGINTIRELDAAMTEVRKVSNATEAQYASFRDTISSTAKEIATTNKELLNSSADFLRLGYSLDQASDLAKNATLFVNVGDGVDITEATEDMITAMKAFDIQAEDSIKIVDDYNQIGNQFALSATDIGEAMKRSASALETGNNSFEQSISLITAMNEIIQNSENTGNSLKVLSLRLRGAKAELESMSEDTDGLCESTSKLREQIQSLTGVDIMLNDNTFKSTTDIIKELGAVWDKLSDSSQAATLEIIAGKSRANNVAALLKNYQKIDEVMESLGDAEGSALRENEAIVDSIDGRIKVLSATVEDFWQKFIDTDLVKDTISSLSGILNLLTKIIDKVGLLPTLLTPIGAIIGKKLGYASI